MPKGEKINGKGYQKCTKAEKEARIELGAQWLMERPDASFTDFCNWFKAKFDVLQRMAAQYYKLSQDHIGGVYEENLEAARKKAELSLKQMLSHANKNKDYNLALKIRQELNKISGLYTQKLQIEDVSEKPIFNIEPIKASTKDKEQE